MNLRENRKVLRDQIAEHVSVLVVGYPVGQVAPVLEELVPCFEALGICHLLVFADAERFYRHLTFGAQARRWFLRRSLVEKNVDDPHLARSRWDSALFAMAAGDFALANEIGDLEPQAFIPSGEYEDDFCFFFFLDRLIRGAGGAELGALLARFADIVGDDVPARLEVCRALLAREPQAFDNALATRIDEHQAMINELREVFSDDATFDPRSRVFVEGLALLRIADRLGIAPKAWESPLCPSSARVNPRRSAPDDLFVDIERSFGAPD
jgi:hypothetical protein